MALVGNGFRLLSNPARVLASGLTAQSLQRSGWNRPGDSRNLWAGEAGVSNVQAIPSGTRPPACWVIAPKSGGIASRNEIDGDGNVTAANLAGGLYGESAIVGTGDLAADITALAALASSLAGTGDLTAAAVAVAEIASAMSGSGTLSADVVGIGDLASAMAGAGDLTGALGLVVFAVATINGVGSLEAAMGLVVQAQAAIGGSGTLSADVIGALDLSASLAGTGDLAGALGALASAVAALSGTGSLTGTPYATGTLAADITSEGELLTTGNVGAAVWNALASALGDPGTMGELLIGAGGGSSPSLVADAVWAHASGVDVATKMALVAKILRNRTETNPATGVMTVYDDDNTTPLLTANLYEDVAAATPYDGTAGSNRRNRLA